VIVQYKFAFAFFLCALLRVMTRIEFAFGATDRGLESEVGRHQGVYICFQSCFLARHTAPFQHWLICESCVPLRKNRCMS
jgi:hypothetical protein